MQTTTANDEEVIVVKIVRREKRKIQTHRENMHCLPREAYNSAHLTIGLSLIFYSVA